MKHFLSLFTGVVGVWFLLEIGAQAQETGTRGYLGVKVVENAPTLEDIGEHHGVRVESVVENSPAQAAGIRPGDVIVSLGGKVHDWPDRFYAAVEALKPGLAVKVEVLREDVGFEVKVVPGSRAAQRAEKKILYLAETRRVGVRVRSLGRTAARAAGLSPAEGVVLAGFWGMSPWKRDGLKAGDILHIMDGRPLHDPRELIRRIRRKDPGDAVHLEVIRDGKRKVFRTVASRRKRRTERVSIPVLFNYTSRTPDRSSWGVLLDVFQTEWKAGMRTTTLFWVISWTTGEADVLEEIPVPPEGVEP